MVLSNGILKFIFTDTLYIPISEANHISFGVLHYKSALAWSWKKDLIILKDSDDLFLAILVAWLTHYIRFSMLTSIVKVLIFLVALLVCAYGIIEWDIWVSILSTL